MKRRSFLKQSGILAAGTGLRNFLPVAGPFIIEDFSGSCAPAEKKLDRAWVASLYNRGQVTTYSKTKNELRYIGMPVGGICCGTVYVGGDGRLWIWDIFNKNQLGVVTKVLPIKLELFNVKEINNVMGSLYLEPATEVRPLQQGFAIVVHYNGSTIVKRLHQDDWSEVTFEATYPVATVRYIDSSLPVQVSLQAFSPFVPGDAHNSGLPATIQSISIKNVSSTPVQVEVIGWLENKTLLNTGEEKHGFTRENKEVKTRYGKVVQLDCVSDSQEIKESPDFGNMAFYTLEKNATCVPAVKTRAADETQLINDFIRTSEANPIAVIKTSHLLKAEGEYRADFIISWYFPRVSFYGKGPNQGMTVEGADLHFYANQFTGAWQVADYIAQHFKTLREQTLEWMHTWYDSTLPWWFLERTFSNICTLATTTTHRFKSGRYYAWEGIGCCHGNCTHVYQYAHAVSRIFPELERDTRERVDLGIGFDEASGMIRIRGEKTGPSIDGQAGTVLRIYREYLMSTDGKILRDNWPKIRKAVEFIMLQDKNKDGMEDTPMENTLDALWSGEISWIVGLCIAGVLAGAKMAEEMNDAGFADVCRQYVDNGRKNMEASLFNGEYFIHRPDPAVGKKEVGSYNTCHIDQVYGQCWAWQVGLGRILDKDKTMSALQALWKYNYMPDVGPYIKEHPGGRFYALAGEGGMVMNTNPRNDPRPYGEAKAWQIGYFSECMTGFEHQVASHMMAEGMIEESLVLTRSIHDRYHANKRNPFNEIECSDHYGRAMASYGTFLSACGFDYHGPKGYIRFAPKWNEINFKAPFTVAEGWGTYSQEKAGEGQKHKLLLKAGRLMLQSVSLQLINDQPARKVTIVSKKEPLGNSFSQHGKDIMIQLARPVTIGKDIEFLVEIE